MRIARLLFIVCVGATIALAQNQPQRFTIAANSQCVPIRAQNNSTVGIIVSGTWSGTLTPNLQIAGVSGAPTASVSVIPSNSTTTQATITANGGYAARVGGFTQFNLCSTAWSSGTATVDLFSTPAVNAGLLGGGGAGGAVTSVSNVDGTLTISPTTGAVVASITNPSTTVNGQSCALGGTCNVESATAGQVAISGGSGAALTGAPDLTYSGHTFSAISTTIFNLSAAGAGGLIVPTGSPATAAGQFMFTSNGNNYHVFAGGADAIVCPFQSLPTNGDVVSVTVATSNLLCSDSTILATNLVVKNAANSAAGSMTLNLSPITGVAGFRVPVQVGAVASTTGVVDYDSTAGLTHVDINSGIDAVAIASPARIHLTGQTAAVATATLCLAATCGTAGMYHVHLDLYQSGTACSANTTNGVSPSLTWTDTNGTTHSAQGIPMDTNASLVATSGTMAWGATTLGAWGSGDMNISSNGSIIQYAIAFTQCTTGTATYGADLVVSRLQ